MLSAIKDILFSIYDFFTSVVGFFVDFVGDLVSVVQMIGETVVSLPDYFTWLPAEIAALIVAAFGVIVVYKIVGRD